MVVRASHERYDGGGYPDGLAGEAIPLAARIVSACDAFNAMTTDRSYRKALSPRSRGRRAAQQRRARSSTRTWSRRSSPSRRNRLGGVAEPRLITAVGAVPPSLARVEEPRRAPFRVGVVQERWHEDPDEHEAALAEGIAIAAGEGARLVCLQELTLSPYFAVTPDALEAGGGDGRADPRRADGALRGPLRDRARHPRPRVAVRARGRRRAGLQHGDRRRARRRAWSRAPASSTSRSPRATTRTSTSGPATTPRATRSSSSATGRFGFPTCWDQWFPELARAYSLGGAEVIVYPTAIGSEPDHPDFDTQPLWERVITGNGIANGTFMVAVNRIGDEPPLRSTARRFISDPYGRVLVQAPRDEPAVLVADLDLDQRRDWLALFPFLQTRRPETYAALLDAVD